ncbi:MAG: amino acid racemase [Hyphomonadaceae bacterium]|nr:amino acid racemase [Hyphomonadaceae bacterium]
MKAIGILGGMGPAATVDLHAKIIRATPATRDQDHLRILIDSNPALPDRNAALDGTGPSPGPALAAMARGLERSGAAVLVMACNTAHAFQADIEAAVTIPFMSMIEATVDAALAQAPGAKRVGVLAVTGCLRANLHQAAFARRGVATFVTDGADHQSLMDAIARIKAGDTGPDVRDTLRSLAAGFITKGCDAIVAGCTEAPLALRQEDVGAPFIDSTAALAAAVAAFARR